MTDEKGGLSLEQQTTVKHEMKIPNLDIKPDIKLEGMEQFTVRIRYKSRADQAGTFRPRSFKCETGHLRRT